MHSNYFDFANKNYFLKIMACDVLRPLPTIKIHVLATTKTFHPHGKCQTKIFVLNFKSQQRYHTNQTVYLLSF